MNANERLLRAARDGDIGAMRAAIAEGADDLNQALIRAAGEGRALAASYLLDAGADIHFASPLSAVYSDALAAASAGGHSETARLLIERGARASHPNGFALRCAASSGDLETARVLLDAGAVINPQSAAETPLRRAASEGDAAMMELLIERGANIHARGEIALAYAARNGHREAAQLLLDRGASALDASRKLWDEEQRAFLWSLDLAPKDRAGIEKSLAPSQRAKLEAAGD
jgi:ankyrin repeat protein